MVRTLLFLDTNSTMWSKYSSSKNIVMNILKKMCYSNDNKEPRTVKLNKILSSICVWGNNLHVVLTDTGGFMLHALVMMEASDFSSASDWIKITEAHWHRVSFQAGSSRQPETSLHHCSTNSPHKVLLALLALPRDNLYCRPYIVYISSQYGREVV